MARTHESNVRHLKPIKRISVESGIPYGSLRDAHFRGELPVVKIGKNDKYKAWYVDDRDFDAWLETRKATA